MSDFVILNNVDRGGCGGRTGCKNAPAEPHFCPFDEDVNSDCPEDWRECTCCADCAEECAMDV